MCMYENVKSFKLIDFNSSFYSIKTKQGTSQIACDYQYLSEADAVCGNNNNECQAAARSVLMILRGTPGPQLGPRECIKNSCLYSAMREIGL